MSVIQICELKKKKKKKKDNKLKYNQMLQPKLEFNKKIHHPKLDVQQRIKNSPREREREREYSPILWETYR